MRSREGSGSTVLRGSALVAVGLIVSGVGTLVMVGVASRGLGAQDFAAFTTWWLTAAILAPLIGVFEVYLARALLTRESQGRPAADVIAQIFGLSLVASVLIAALTIPFAPLLADRIFNGHLWAPFLIPIFAAVVSVQSVQRGVAAGRRAFGVIGLQLSLDGVLRATIAAVIIAAGGGSWIFTAPVLAGIISVALASPALPGWLHVPHPFRAAVDVRPIGWLLIAAGGPVLIGNAVAPWFAAAAASDVFLVAGFSAALLISRVPTQLASAAFAPVMAHMAQAVDRRDDSGLRSIRRSAIGWAGLLGIGFILGFTMLGQWALDIYVGPGYSVPRWTLGVLAAASAGLLIATIQQAALTAQNRWGTIAVGWVVGSVVFAATLLLPLSPLARASSAPLLGVTAAVLTMELVPRVQRKAQNRDRGPARRW
ncbi:MAG TPA: hypothetical protein VES02_15190 [Dermatophilaceae bacterium]|nr:hypothetical protein [Dermatophilaceae bacterium]